MFGAEQAVGTGVFQLALLTVLPGVGLWLLLNGRQVAARLARAARRAHVLAAPPERPAGPPLEKIAADIRRIAAQLEANGPEATRVRRVATILAYDEALAAACHALGLPDTLTALPVGPPRDAERGRVEQALAREGLLLPPRRAA